MYRFRSHLLSLGTTVTGNQLSINYVNFRKMFGEKKMLGGRTETRREAERFSSSLAVSQL